MPTRIGLDISSIDGWRRRIRRTPEVARLAFTPAERAWAISRPENAATLWAIKEAVVKTLGTGFAGIGWHGVEIDPTGADLAVTSPPLPHWAVEPVARWWIGTALVDGWATAMVTCSTTPLRVALRMHRLRASERDPTARAYCQSAAARILARDAASSLLPAGSDPGMLIWAVNPGGGPSLCTTTGIQIAISLSHCSGAVAAAAALRLPQPCSLSDHQLR